MSATLTRPAAPPVKRIHHAVRDVGDGLVRFTSDDLPHLREIGVIPDDSTVELLDGLLVYRDCGSSKGEPGMASFEHDYVVTQVGTLAVRVNTADRHVRTQVTIPVAERYSPIPDAVILRGPATSYRDRQPTAVDVLCLIEVSDTSYVRDAGSKLAAYARAGVPQYVIIDLRTRTAAVYAEPNVLAGTYPPPLLVAADGALALRVGDAEPFAVPLADLLP